MSQNPYGQYPSNPNDPGTPGAAYAGSQPPTPNLPSPNPPSGPNPAYPNQPSGPIPAIPNPASEPGTNPPNAGYLAPPYGQPANVPLYGSPGGFPPPMPPLGPPPQSIPGMNLYGPPSQPLNVAPTRPISNPQSMPGMMGTPPAPLPPPPQRRGRGRIILIVVIILLVVIGGSLIGVVTYNNNQATVHTNATATAQNQAAHTQATVSTRATAAASATERASTFPFSDNVILKDQLSDDSNTQYGWDNNNQGCSFINGSYNVRTPQANTYLTCGARNLTVTNFTLQVQMSAQLGGNGAAGGIFFRGNEDTAQYYLFTLDTQGNYALYIETNTKSTNSRTLKFGQVGTSFSTGFNVVNTIAVVADGSQISIYVDSTTTPIFQITDSTYTSGQLGFISEADSTGRAVITYNEAEVWQLPS